MTQFSSRDEPPRSEPSRLIGFQKDPENQQRQRQQQRADNKAASAPIDLRDKINAGKRASEAVEQQQSNSTTTTTAPAVSPTQPEARRQRITRKLFTSAETQHLYITARRKTQEVPATTEEADSPRQKYEIATRKGDPATQRRIEKATVGVFYTRPVKKPVFSTDGSPMVQSLTRRIGKS